MLIFESSRPGRYPRTQAPKEIAPIDDLPAQFLRTKPPALPEVSELDVVRHYTQLSQKNFSIDTHFYPLGSCTMKYNPRACHTLASLPGFSERHPATPELFSQGFLACLYELQEILAAATGMQEMSLAPMAGAQGEFSGVAMIRAYHEARGDKERTEMLVPDAAHGTNPATATMCGFQVREIPTNQQGDIDLEALRKTLGPKTAGIMLTNPSTLGIFDRNIKAVAESVHNVGGLLYYDGANLNAILGKVKPGDMGFDVIHLNLHKTFATPHGSGGPGAGPVGVGKKLLPFLPIPRVGKTEDGTYRWFTEEDCPQSIGRLSAWMGNAGVLLRAYIYIRLLGREGMKRVADFSALNANYLSKCLTKAGFDLAYPSRRASHEFVITLKRQAKELGVTATDFAKRLLDLGFHAPTIYFPLLVPECLLIEPAETESKQTLDFFVEAMKQITKEAQESPEQLKLAPYTLPVRRLDEVRAARELDLAWKPAP
ncbi:glycine dehydrogenase subunit 2 [Candidatus Nitrosoglobus terrae]|uniref:Probable glycine dehydrogenase (decarboxylating) subunit 2 n=1 Tax=Candidatus Nitrosoglobus terrae TaxID=1630141 RepID=A0A1Q2SKZ9_9GAMM|nr:aminomethyl-transferring glycine dehydrogenase subunit GcvPB [Candidatus Nitrosoglobus terrae]BAW79794.1 glycine dehydrogenase subunit 2 [Candidatus Nitrosoglobus terrae]